jgi:hypothetical protein
VLAHELPADWEPVLECTGKCWSIILREVNAEELHRCVLRLFTKVAADADSIDWFWFWFWLSVSITNFHEQFVNCAEGDEK